nr:flagellar hook-basal body complex protein [uncultured Desulfobacter sp.]
MSLTSSLYAGTSGLSNTGNALQVTSNNISNINTLGFKKGTATFADTLYQTIGTNAGSSQVGLGMNVDNVAQVFTDGSLETTSNATDLAIGGDGFFVVSESGSEENYYTRAGNFSFDENGALVTSEGYNLQGWYVEGDTGEEYGAVTDLILTEFTSPPDDTNEITVITNLDSDAESKSMVLSNLFQYNEDDGTTVDSDGYEYQTVVSVYDSLGSSHEVTIYYDKKSDTEWEYIVACDPDEDNRATVADTDAAGLLARGTITFSESSGDVVSMTMEELTGVIGNVEVTGNNTVDDVHFEIENSDVIQEDGYDMSLYYDGDDWTFDTSTNPLPDAYSNADIIFSNETTIYIDLDGSGVTDLKISLDEYATADSTLTFDINNPSELHIQDLENVVYDGEVYNNTTLSINDSSVMTTSVEDLSIFWDVGTETWYWNELDPDNANDADTLIKNNGVVGTIGDVSDPSVMDVAVKDISVSYDGSTSTWDWTDGLIPVDYPDAIITSSNADGFVIDFDGTGTSILTIIDLAGEDTFSFDVNPYVPPDEYSSATLSGDATYCSIDLDGSGNEDDEDDIVFTFEDELEGLVDSTISFNISGSTAWRTVTTDEAEETGYYQFTADFLGGEYGATETDISFNIGSKFDGSNWINDSLSSTQYAISSSTTYQDSDGYASGDLTGIEVDSGGLVSGSYSNGQELALFMVALADFNNVNGLISEGGNLYSATTESGSAVTNKPGENGLGTLSSYALEMSNVDISEEFVDMIGLQTAYEANAKIISTVDEMMTTVISMKR